MWTLVIFLVVCAVVAGVCVVSAVPSQSSDMAVGTIVVIIFCMFMTGMIMGSYLEATEIYQGVIPDLVGLGYMTVDADKIADISHSEYNALENRQKDAVDNLREVVDEKWGRPLK